MTTATYRYSGPRRTAKRTGKCPVCGKPATRSRTFERTVNPLNKRPDGAPKTWADVLADVQADIDAWNPDPEVFTHEKCRPGGAPPGPVAPQPRDPAVSDRTRTVAAALVEVVDVLTALQLAAQSIDIHPPVGENLTVSIGLPHRPLGEFMRWLAELPFDMVRVQAHGDRTDVTASCPYGRLTWRVHATIDHAGGERLHGADVDWSTRNGRRTGYGRTTAPQLIEALKLQGVAPVVPPQNGP